MTSQADTILAMGLASLRHRIEQTIRESEFNCLPHISDICGNVRLTELEFGRIIASQVLAQYSEQAFIGPTAQIAYDEYCEWCRRVGCQAHSWSLYNQILRLWFREMAKEFGADRVFRLAS